MKKLLVFLMAFMFIVPVANAQFSDKFCKKEAKRTAKLLRKSGYDVFASSITLETALYIHNKKVLGVDGVYDQPGVANRVKSKNVGMAWAKQNACQLYAQGASNHIKGRILTEMKGDIINSETEMDNFYAAYEAQIETEIKGVLADSYSVIKDNGDGTYEIQSHFIINEEAAHKARMRAMENAMKESAVAQEHAKKISEFVNEGFKPVNN